MRLTIRNTDRSILSTEITSDGYVTLPLRREIDGNSHSKGDPIHSALTDLFNRLLKRVNYAKWETILTIGGLPIHVKYDGKYYLMGKSHSLKLISSSLARISYSAAVGETDSSKLLNILFSNMEMPEPISYAIENRAPYHFYENYDRVEVRLNVEKIGPVKYAIEVSDSVWGEISQKDLVTFVNSYRDGSKRGKWNNLSPRNLFSKLMGREPSESELKLMKAFLSQNRTSDIVEKRAKELVEEICQNFPKTFFYHSEEEGTVIETKTHEKFTKGKPSIITTEQRVSSNNNEWLFIRGNSYDWKIRKSSNRESTQSVQTYIWQRFGNNIKVGQEQDEDGEWVDVFETVHHYGWAGPICVDNMNFSGATSIGDQMVARGFAFMNDSATIRLVSTIGSYLNKKDMSENRLNFEDLIKNDLGRLL